MITSLSTSFHRHLARYPNLRFGKSLRMAPKKSTQKNFAIQKSLSLPSCKTIHRSFYSTNPVSNTAIPTIPPQTTTPTPTGDSVREFTLSESSGVDSTQLAEMMSKMHTEINLTSIIPLSPETLSVHTWLVLQQDLGVPLWAAMALTTWGLRLMTTPVFIAQVKNMAILQIIAPKVQKIKANISANEDKGDQVMVSYWEGQLKALYKTYDAAPWKNFSSAFVTVPLMIAQSVGARYMLENTSSLLVDAGPMWLSNLTIPDPMFITPIIYVALQLAILRFSLPMQTGIIGNLSELPKWTWALIATYAGVLAYICTQFPGAISSIWIYSMMFTLASNVLASIPAVRRFFGVAIALPSTRPSSLPPIQENGTKNMMDPKIFKESIKQSEQSL